jgi:DNA-binding NtrC family response regulator
MLEKILFVDDEPQVLEGLGRLLHGTFQIETAISGAEALRKLKRSGPYAVVVCDMRMPEMDGAQLLSKVKVDFPESVRIMLTGNSDQETAVRAVNEGHIFRFLTKPCDEELLTKALNAALVHYRLASHKEELLEKARGGRKLPPETRNYAGYEVIEQKVRELLSRDATTAFPNDSGVYFGKTIWEDSDFVVQRLSPVKAIAHPKSGLNKIPPVGEVVKIVYSAGGGEVTAFGS